MREDATPSAARAPFVPVADRDGLSGLEGICRRRAKRLRSVGFSWAALAALLVVINLGTTAFAPGLPAAARAWSVIAILTAALPVAVLWLRVVRLRWIAGAQRSLLGQRGLLGRVSDIRAAEERLRQELEGLSPRLPGLESGLAAARQESGKRIEELSQQELEAGREARGGDDLELHRRRLATILDSYLLAVESLEIDAMLQPAFLRSEAAVGALERAAELLRLADEPEEATPDRVASRAEVSIAVLSFADLSIEGDQEYFADGLAEELINALTRIGSLRVIARGSAFSFRGQNRDVREIGEKLGVQAVIEGSVRKAGDRLRVTVQLIDTADGRHLWSERYDGGVEEVFEIQDRLTASVIDHLTEEPLTAVSAQRVSRRTEDLDAYHFYLRGRHLWNERSPAALRESLRCFESAIERDPRYALAHAGLADSYNLLGYYSLAAPGEVFPQARAAAEEALAIDDGLAQAHSSLAFVLLLYEWDWRGAEREFRRTIELNPGYATARHWFAECLALQGRHDEALSQTEIAVDLDPVSPIIRVLVGWVHYYAGHYDRAIEALHQTLEMEASFAPAELWLGLSYERLGRFEEAERAFERALATSGRSPVLLAAIARLAAARGDRGRAESVLDEIRALAGSSYVPAYCMASIHSGLGDREATLRWLEVSCGDRESWMTFLNVDPIWEGYRGEPRFRALVEAVGLDQGMGGGSG